MQINHKDGNKKNNYYKNLEWVTHQQNIDHAARNGLQRHLCGESHPNSKLTEEAVRRIRSLKGQTTQLAKEYNVDKSLIKYVRQRKIWGHI